MKIKNFIVVSLLSILLLIFGFNFSRVLSTQCTFDADCPYDWECVDGRCRNPNLKGQWAEPTATESPTPITEPTPTPTTEPTPTPITEPTPTPSPSPSPSPCCECASAEFRILDVNGNQLELSREDDLAIGRNYKNAKLGKRSELINKLTKTPEQGFRVILNRDLKAYKADITRIYKAVKKEPVIVREILFAIPTVNDGWTGRCCSLFYDGLWHDRNNCTGCTECIQKNPPGGITKYCKLKADAECDPNLLACNNGNQCTQDCKCKCNGNAQCSECKYCDRLRGCIRSAGSNCDGPVGERDGCAAGQLCVIQSTSVSSTKCVCIDDDNKKCEDSSPNCDRPCRDGGGAIDNTKMCIKSAAGACNCKTRCGGTGADTAATCGSGGCDDNKVCSWDGFACDCFKKCGDSANACDGKCSGTTESCFSTNAGSTACACGVPCAGSFNAAAANKCPGRCPQGKACNVVTNLLGTPTGCMCAP